MRLNKSDRIVRWAYWLRPDGEKIPERTSVCALFWRAVLFTPIKVFVLGGIVIMFSPLWVPLWAGETYCKHRRRVLGADYVPFSERIQSRLDRSVLYQGIAAIKNKVCPIVVIQAAREDGR